MLQGAVLSQVGEDSEEHPIAYASWKLKPRESRYSTIEKECLAAVWALKHFGHYVYGQPFTLVTDHRPLIWLKTMKNSNQRLTCWAVFLQQFKMEVQHRLGSQHKNADGLSWGGRDVTEPTKSGPDSRKPMQPWTSGAALMAHRQILLNLLYCYLNIHDCLQFC